MMYEFVYKPYLQTDKPEPITLWEGEISEKYLVSGDKPRYYLLINSTEWKEVNTQIEYEKYGIGTYVYYVQSEGFFSWSIK